MTQSVRTANNFDFLRLALSVLVIYSHSYPLAIGAETTEPLIRWTHGQMSFGAVAVDIFFVMSGYLITASAFRSRGFIDFLKKRVQRIYPAFVLNSFLTLLIVIPLAGGHLSGSLVPGIAYWFMQVLRLQEFQTVHSFASNPFPIVVNGSVWSISYEFWCYVGIGMLMVTRLLNCRRLLLLCFLAAWIVGITFQAEAWVLGGGLLRSLLGLPRLWARLLPFYLGGTVFYLFRDRVRWNRWAALGCVAALVVASFFSLGWATVFPLVAPYLAFFIAFHPVPVLQDVGRFGDFSYGTYLYAFPVQQLLMKAIGYTVPPWQLFAMATPLTLLLAAGSWYGVERPLLNAKRRKETVIHALEAETNLP